VNPERKYDYMAKFTGHSGCPKCGSRDNRANYSDGGWFCFGCGDSGRSLQSGFVSDRDAADDDGCGDGVDAVTSPTDCTTSYPTAIVQYLARYSISVESAIHHGIKYSPYWNQLIYEYKDKEGRIRCIQARNFDPDRAAKAKYYNQGSASEVSPIYRGIQQHCVQHSNRDNDVCRLVSFPKRLVITEDALSAIRIASQCDAMPALGTNVPAHKIIALKPFYEFITIWLDSDKWREAREIAEKCKWVGLGANTVYSDLDPKCYSNLEITKYLTRN
jgi:hypothetical protein